MQILIIGGGGREHALAWSCSASPLCSSLFVMPGNAGTASIATNVDIDPARTGEVIRFIGQKAVDFVVIGPEAPLAAGLADALGEAGIRCFGPSARATRLESSKIFTRELCVRLGLPAPEFTILDDEAQCADHLTGAEFPLVLKLDGLASGKGVRVVWNLQQATEAIADFVAGDAICPAFPLIAEEWLDGPEISCFFLVDGQNWLPFGTAQDYKAAYEGDRGPNTGGMGGVSPSPHETPSLLREVGERFVGPVLDEMARQGTPYAGMLYLGMMKTEDGLKLLEINCRFGDPECQALLPRLRSDLLPALIAVRDRMIADFDLRWSDEACVNIVLANEGYPGPASAGGPISGLSFLAGDPMVTVFHSGTQHEGGGLVAAGGRVLSVSGLGANVSEARERAWSAASAIRWSGAWFRHDIGLPGSHRQLMRRIREEPEVLEPGLRIVETPFPDPLIDLSCRDAENRLTAVILHRTRLTLEILDRTRTWLTQASGWEGEARMILAVGSMSAELEGRARSVRNLSVVVLPERLMTF